LEIQAINGRDGKSEQNPKHKGLFASPLLAIIFIDHFEEVP
jgi:hypothetical protein